MKNELDIVVDLDTPTEISVLDFVTKSELANKAFRQGYDEGYADGLQEGIEL